MHLENRGNRANVNNAHHANAGLHNVVHGGQHGDAPPAPAAPAPAPPPPPPAAAAPAAAPPAAAAPAAAAPPPAAAALGFQPYVRPPMFALKVLRDICGKLIDLILSFLRAAKSKIAKCPKLQTG